MGMLRSAVLSALLGLCGADLFRPSVVDYGDLVDEPRFHGGEARGVLEEALSADGVVQVTGIPEFPSLREHALRHAHACIAQAPRARQHVFSDGTVRRTLAAASGSELGQQAFDHGSATGACRAFERASLAFRNSVAGVADAFVKRLGSVLDLEGSAPLLLRATGGSYSTLEQVAKAGERLEHFHSYQVPGLAGAEKPTIDFHVDQGLFIAFAPALMVDQSAALPRAPMPTGAFLIKTREGKELETELRTDVVVFLLGDGVNQYVNKAHRGAPLHAPGHAFRMPEKGSGLHRVWYGMMQLPPSDARSEAGFTFGELRERTIEAAASGGPDSEAVLALGCSGQRRARELMDACGESQIYCWHSCVNHTADLSPSACAAKGSELKCVNQFDQVYISGHGDFWPTCSQSTTLYAPRPPVQQPTGACAGWSDLVSDRSYAHRAALVPGETHLLWNVVGDKLEAKMVHNGLVGWMAIGIENVGGGLNGMSGAQVVMGKNDPTSVPSVAEYQVHQQNSAHHFWKTPLSPTALTDAEMVLTACFSSIKFKTRTIYNVPLNVTSGTDRLIWALTHFDYPTMDSGGYAGYHASTTGNSSNFRGHVHLDFAGGWEVGSGAAAETSHSRRPFWSSAIPAAALFAFANQS